MAENYGAGQANVVGFHAGVTLELLDKVATGQQAVAKRPQVGPAGGLASGMRRLLGAVQALHCLARAQAAPGQVGREAAAVRAAGQGLDVANYT